MQQLKRKKVALLVRTTNEWSRQILMGVAQYAQEQRGWNFTHPACDQNGEVFLPPDWEGDGIICRLSSDRVLEQVLASGAAAVNLSWLPRKHPEIVNVVSDQATCARMCVEYFLERKFRNFAYIGVPPWHEYGSAMPDTIRSCLSEQDLELSDFRFPTEDIFESGFRPRVKQWLIELEKPAAIIVWSSMPGRVVSSICGELDISIPDSISILCVEHDDLASNLSAIPLSSLDQDGWRVGYCAAQALNEMMGGKQPSKLDIKIPPKSVLQRRSSEASAVDDPEVCAAFQFIHEEVPRGLKVDDVVQEICVSRRTLEKKFQDSLGMTPSQVIRQSRLLVVKRLLRETTLTIPQIAKRSGFNNSDVMVRALKRDTGLTPTGFRESDRSG